MLDTIKDIIAEQLNINRDIITPESSFVEDLNADSLDLMELIMAFSDEFDIDISDEEAEKIKTVGDVLDYLKGNEN